MTLTIVCKDKSQQQLHLAPSFSTQSSKAGMYFLTKGEIQSKALTTAISIVGGLYDYHLLSGLDDDMREIRELKP